MRWKLFRSFLIEISSSYIECITSRCGMNCRRPTFTSMSYQTPILKGLVGICRDFAEMSCVVSHGSRGNTGRSSRAESQRYLKGEFSYCSQCFDIICSASLVVSDEYSRRIKPSLVPFTYIADLKVSWGQKLPTGFIHPDRACAF